MLRYCLLVTGPPYGTQQASSAYQFAQALLEAGHQLASIFFYREGVLNANCLISPASDEFNLVRAWQQLAQAHNIVLNVCISAASRRGVTGEQKVTPCYSVGTNLQAGFLLSGLTEMAATLSSCDRVVQF